MWKDHGKMVPSLFSIPLPCFLQQITMTELFPHIHWSFSLYARLKPSDFFFIEYSEGFIWPFQKNLFFSSSAIHCCGRTDIAVWTLHEFGQQPADKSNNRKDWNKSWSWIWSPNHENCKSQIWFLFLDTSTCIILFSLFQNTSYWIGFSRSIYWVPWHSFYLS